MSTSLQGRQEIRDCIEGWAIWKDSGDWESLRTCWHDGAIISTPWFRGSSDQFMENAAKAFDHGGPDTTHFLGGTAIVLNGGRAVAQTKMMSTTRMEVGGAKCHQINSGRFYDFFEKREGRWAIVERQPIYETNRLDPVDPLKPPKLDRELLDTIPEGYRYLGYAALKRGIPVKLDMPGLRGPEVEALYARGKAWLAGSVRP